MRGVAGEEEEIDKSGVEMEGSLVRCRSVERSYRKGARLVLSR